MIYKIDLHSHSVGSPDGALKLKDYMTALSSTTLDYIAITDHDSIETALRIRGALGEYSDRVIIGEEITTKSGEIIGLYLKRKVNPGMSLAETVADIKNQNGLVYIPHPFETVRKGLSMADLDTITRNVDIIEVCNGRAVFQDRGERARKWAEAHAKSIAASSDAHGRFGWGKTCTLVDTVPTRDNLTKLLKSPSLSTHKVGVGILYPKLNRLRKMVSNGTV